jgi:hypothetical protein
MKLDVQSLRRHVKRLMKKKALIKMIILPMLLMKFGVS